MHVAGTNCDIDIDECASSPCNDGSCTDQVDGYYCTCEPGFTGTYCETNINECESAPCQNGATCVDGRDGYVCDCVAGYTGDMLYNFFFNNSFSFAQFVLNAP